MKIFLLLFITLLIQPVKTQVPIDTALIIAQLKIIHERDQKARSGKDSVQFIRFLDSTNQVLIKKLIASYGWPGKSFVGDYGNYTVFLVIQHADLPVQEKYFPLFKESVDKGESRACDLAYLQDRILMRQGKNQLYGSQIVMNNQGGQEFYPIEDPEHINDRRKTVGLGPIEEYAERFGIELKPPDKK